MKESIFEMIDELKECEDTVWLTSIETVTDRLVNILISNGYEKETRERFPEMGL